MMHKPVGKEGVLWKLIDGAGSVFGLFWCWRNFSLAIHLLFLWPEHRS